MVEELIVAEGVDGFGESAVTVFVAENADGGTLLHPLVVSRAHGPDNLQPCIGDDVKCSEIRKRRNNYSIFSNIFEIYRG